MSQVNHHHDWLSLIEISGPFLAVPVLKEAFPQGLDELYAGKRKRLRQAYDEWREAQETNDPHFNDLHSAWIDEVLSRGLEFDEDSRGDVLKRKEWCTTHLTIALPEHGVSLSPDFAVVNNGDKPLMLVHAYAPDIDLDATSKLDGWVSTPTERMVTLCRATGCRLGLATNGERWMLVDAPVGAVTTFASWYARIWVQEPVTLQAFVHLLGIRRFFVDESERLPALFDRSLKHQDEVTDALGEQVRRAVEVLIQSLDKADQDRDRELLRDVKPAELYEAALTVMMRLVFLLSAEERGLLLLGDECYEANYALSTLRMQLRTESEEILERRWDAWSRLLALFRAVYGGIEHENLRLPALGGSLFDPDRFSFLEGRARGSSWRDDIAKPLPIDNRTVLLLLDAIQQFQGRTLSYRALDVEQIGYVYEGLLERTVKRTTDVTLELDATKSAKTPWVTLAELESARLDGADRLAELLKERSGSSASRISNDLKRPIDDALADRLLTACHGDTALRDRIKPFGHLVRTDLWGYPLVYPAGAFIVTTGSDRRETGTHYTPKSLTEAIVTETLTPIAYVGPAQGTPRAEWALKSPAELLSLKICDPAMGSGAFLVQACRWLADRLVEAWAQAEDQGHTVGVDGRVADAAASTEALPRDIEARTLIARRLIAERCLYGVDLNPLAVELAKLSIWLVTLAKGRPFGFLDHNLRCGDSLLGIHRLDQLTQLSMNPSDQGQLRLFGQSVEQAVREAIELRQQLREIPIRDIRDVEAMAHLDADARRRLDVPESIADAFIGEVFATGGNYAKLENTLVSLTVQAGRAIDGDSDSDMLALMHRRSVAALSTDLPVDKPTRRPFHWPLEFPEAFVREARGFDAIVGNPPFSGGRWIGRRFGLIYQEYLKLIRNGVVGSPDLCVYFYLRSFSLLGTNGCFGLLATKSITETGSRIVCLDQIIGMGGIVYRGCSRMAWPGNAAVVVSIAWVARNGWQGRKVLDDQAVSAINGALEEDFEIKRPLKLKALKGTFSQGQDIMGRGFELTAEERAEMLAADPSSADVIFPLFNGQDLNTLPKLEPYRWVIYFRDWPEAQARKYGAAFRRVEELVKPYRDGLTGQIHQNCFWKLWDLRPGLMREFAAMQFALAIASVTKYLCVSRVPTSAVYNMQVKVLFHDRFVELSVLQSSLHDVWARWLCGTLGASTLRYSTSTVLETWPMPAVDDNEELEILGERYHVRRESLMANESIGLTQLYNRFHNQSDDDPRIETMRELHREIDLAVAHAYGWNDLNLEHGFHEVSYLPENDRVRFTISETARVEVLRRLSELNRQRYETEVAQGLHGNTTTRVLRASRTINTAAAQPAFDFDTTPVNEARRLTAAEPRIAYHASPVRAIGEYLKAHPGWHAKAEILSATGITDSQWNVAIAELTANGRVERQGEKRGARYRFSEDAQ
jgi:hypothetical protein